MIILMMIIMSNNHCTCESDGGLGHLFGYSSLAALGAEHR